MAIKNLIGLQAKTVRLIRNEQELEVAVEDVLVGDLVLVRPGEIIPVDSGVVEGCSAVDESIVMVGTGKSAELGI